MDSHSSSPSPKRRNSSHLRFETNYVFDESADMEHRSEELKGYEFLKNHFPFLLIASRITGLRSASYGPEFLNTMTRGNFMLNNSGVMSNNGGASSSFENHDGSVSFGSSNIENIGVENTGLFGTGTSALQSGDAQRYRRGSVVGLLGLDGGSQPHSDPYSPEHVKVVGKGIGKSTISPEIKKKTKMEFVDRVDDIDNNDDKGDIQSSSDFAAVNGKSEPVVRGSSKIRLLFERRTTSKDKTANMNQIDGGKSPNEIRKKYYDDDSKWWRKVDMFVPFFWISWFVVGYVVILFFLDAVKPSTGLTLTFLASHSNGVAKFLSWRCGCNFRKSICAAFSDLAADIEGSNGLTNGVVGGSGGIISAKQHSTMRTLDHGDAKKKIKAPLPLRITYYAFLNLLSTTWQWAAVFVSWYYFFPTDWQSNGHSEEFNRYLSIIISIVYVVPIFLQVVATMGLFHCGSVCIILNLKTLRKDMAKDLRNAIVTQTKIRETFCHYIGRYQKTRQYVENFAEGTQYYYFVAEFLLVIIFIACVFDLFKNPQGVSQEEWVRKMKEHPEVYSPDHHKGEYYFSFYKLWIRLYLAIVCPIILVILVLASLISDEGQRLREKSLPFQYVELGIVTTSGNYNENGNNSNVNMGDGGFVDVNKSGLGVSVGNNLLESSANTKFVYSGAAQTTKNLEQEVPLGQTITRGKDSEENNRLMSGTPGDDHDYHTGKSMNSDDHDYHTGKSINNTIDTSINMMGGDEDTILVTDEEIVEWLTQLQVIMSQNKIEYTAFGILINTSNMLRLFYILVSGLVFIYVEFGRS